jgi:integrase
VHRVEYRLGGRESSIRYAGTFAKKSDAEKRKAWVIGELAAMRVPDIRLVQPKPVETLQTVAERWRSSRISVADSTRGTHAVNLGRILPVLGSRTPEEITKADVVEFVAKLHGGGLARESIRKTVSTLAMILDYVEVPRNPARRVELPKRDVEEVQPPSADHVQAILGAVPRPYRLPVMLLDATGMRVGELERLTWGDIDEDGRQWRVSAARTKTRRARWVAPPASLLDAVLDLLPREERDLEARVFGENVDTRLRTAIGRACRATGTPLFSPHDLRHRRASLMHLAGTPAAEAGKKLGQSAQEHLRTYAHVVLDRREIDYAEWLERDRVVLAPVLGKA